MISRKPIKPTGITGRSNQLAYDNGFFEIAPLSIREAFESINPLKVTDILDALLDRSMKDEVLHAKVKYSTKKDAILPCSREIKGRRTKLFLKNNF